MLTRLPPELLGLVIEKLRGADLKAVSQTSKYLHSAVTKTLWRSVSIDPWKELPTRATLEALSQIRLPDVRHLRFGSNPRFAAVLGCPHLEDDDNVWATDSEDDGERTDKSDGNSKPDDKQAAENSYEPRFRRLTKIAELVAKRLEDNQLQSYSWDLGACVPSSIFGPEGLISLKQPLIRSLSLTSDHICYLYTLQNSPVDISAFRELRSLTWKAPHHKSFGALADAISKNSAHLEELDLDFVSWQDLWNRIDEGMHADDGVTAYTYFANNILRADNQAPGLVLPTIRVLSLTQVPLSAAMASAINFGTLVSLKLRMCLNWDRFARRVAQLKLPINLKTLEIQDGETMSDERGAAIALATFIEAFEGLEELYVAGFETTFPLSLWHHAAHHHKTLKKFVHHERTWQGAEGEHDSKDLGLWGQDMFRPWADPSHSPLANIDLEFIGFSCVPQFLKILVSPFTSKTTLKVVHIRQSLSDLEFLLSWAVEDEVDEHVSDTKSDATSESKEATSWSTYSHSAGSDVDESELNSTAEGADRSEELYGVRFNDAFCEFAEWVFGPEGIPSLQVVIFGDFAHGGFDTPHNFALCRQTDGNGLFRVMTIAEPGWQDICEAYGAAMEACPVVGIYPEV